MRQHSPSVSTSVINSIFTETNETTSATSRSSPSSISPPTKAVDELRRRLDRNGYVLQPFITVDHSSPF
ncbi:unnamed protein product [Thelazia callipaeda]|uniref:Uncharacterized protein n=1 Tax=Thelazia callipaeda TaxID=103827 RepID=A0A0N5CTN8_THECL|nr:unnamed protein product [Thelazia callipaeda]